MAFTPKWNISRTYIKSTVAIVFHQLSRMRHCARNSICSECLLLKHECSNMKKSRTVYIVGKNRNAFFAVWCDMKNRAWSSATRNHWGCISNKSWAQSKKSDVLSVALCFCVLLYVKSHVYAVSYRVCSSLKSHTLKQRCGGAGLLDLTSQSYNEVDQTGWRGDFFLYREPP
jgi:hypothetical protein